MMSEQRSEILLQMTDLYLMYTRLTYTMDQNGRITGPTIEWKDGNAEELFYLLQREFAKDLERVRSDLYMKRQHLTPHPPNPR